METESSSPYPQVPATRPYPEPTIHYLSEKIKEFGKDRTCNKYGRREMRAEF